MSRNWKSAALRLAISFSAIGLIIYSLRGKLGEAVSILAHEVDWRIVSAAFATYLFCQIIFAFRLHLVLLSQEIHIKFRETLYLAFIGLFFNLFLPSAVGGDVAKIYYISKHSARHIEGAAAILLDRILGFISLIVIALAAVGIMSAELDNPNLNYVVYFFFSILVLTLLFFTNKKFAGSFGFMGRLIPSEKIRTKIKHFYEAIHGFQAHKKIGVFCLGFSFLAQFIIIMCHYLIALSLGIELSVRLFFVLVPLVFIVSMAPSLGGLGVREAGAIYLFSRYVEPERALALSLLMDLLIYGVSIGAGIVYGLKGGLKDKTKGGAGSLNGV